MVSIPLKFYPFPGASPLSTFTIYFFSAAGGYPPDENILISIDFNPSTIPFLLPFLLNYLFQGFFVLQNTMFGDVP